MPSQLKSRTKNIKAWKRGRSRWPWIVAVTAITAFVPVLAVAATGTKAQDLAMSAATLAFAGMLVAVVLMWRHFARRMLAEMRPRWEDWG